MKLILQVQWYTLTFDKYWSFFFMELQTYIVKSLNTSEIGSSCKGTLSANVSLVVQNPKGNEIYRQSYTVGVNDTEFVLSSSLFTSFGVHTVHVPLFVTIDANEYSIFSIPLLTMMDFRKKNLKQF